MLTTAKDPKTIGSEKDFVRSYSVNNYSNLAQFKYKHTPREKVYVVLYEDRETNLLREARVRKVYYFNGNNIVVLADVAGLGLRYLYGNNTYYATKEDYAFGRNCNICDSKDVDVTEEMKKMGELMEYCGGSYVVRRYAWIGNEMAVTDAHYAITYDVATKTFGHLCVEEFDGGPFKYKSRMECMNDNTIAVCEFKDTDEVDRQVWIDLIDSFAYKSGKSIDEIKEDVSKKFGDKNYRLFVDGVCVADNS